MAVDALGSISAGPLSLTVGETFTDNIASTSDVDYFKISSSDISVPSTATVTFTGLSSTTNNNELISFIITMSLMKLMKTMKMSLLIQMVL